MFYPENGKTFRSKTILLRTLQALVKRTPGIATVWLMATLGARQNSKRVSKQAILQVDIPETCHAVHNAQAPMALRLQSNLLYGISRVYSQKCVYILTDAESARSALRSMSKLVKTSELDARAGIVRPETLVVPDDPLFVPEIQFDVTDFAASAFDSSGSSFMSNSGKSDMSKLSSRSAKSLHDSDLPQLEMPDSGSFDDIIDLPPPMYPSNRQLSSDIDDDGLLQDLGFGFDESGNIIDYEMFRDGPRTSDVEAQFELEGNDPAVEVPQAVEFVTEQDLQQPITGNNGFLLEGENNDQAQYETEQEQNSSEVHTISQSAASEYVEVPQLIRRRSRVSVLPRDRILQLPNIELQRLQLEYLSDMQKARYLKQRRQQSRQVKADIAAMLENFGQIRARGTTNKALNPLSEFAKDLLQHLTGANSVKSAKRRHQQSDSTSETNSSTLETRASRIRLDEEAEKRRAETLDEEGFMPPADDPDASVELARQAMTTLEDYSTQLRLPWSGTRPGSVHSGRLSRQASILSARGQVHHVISRAGSVTSFDRRASRLPTTSPVPGRGSIRQPNQNGGDSTGLLPGFVSGADTSPERQKRDSQDVELLGLAAEVSTQEVNESQWLQDAFDKESTEFLIWIQNHLDAKRIAGEEEVVDGSSMSIRFDELLPAERHSRIVAAQGFLHVLVLANKGMVIVEQDMKAENGNGLWWGPIHLSVAARLAEDGAAA